MRNPRLAMNDLLQKAKALEPWITQFSVLGVNYGGTYDALNDDRVSRVVEFFPQCRRILEVGCLEGGHTVILSRAYPYTDIVALDGRSENIEKANLTVIKYNSTRGGTTHMFWKIDPKHGGEVVEASLAAWLPDQSTTTPPLFEQSIKYDVREVVPGVWRIVGCEGR